MSVPSAVTHRLDIDSQPALKFAMPSGGTKLASRAEICLSDTCPQ
jgi:hypothetical protein